MSVRRAIMLVARREVTSRVRERSFLVSTFLTIAVIAAAAALPAVLSDDGPERMTLAVAGADAERIAQAAARDAGALDLRIAVDRVADAGAARGAVTGGDADAALAGSPPRVLAEDELDARLGALLQEVAARDQRERALSDAGLSPAAREAVLEPAALPVEELDTGGDDEAQGIASIIVLLLYGQLIMYGYWIAAGIVEEKSSRVVEVLLSAIPPRALVLGKLLGLALLGLGQLLLVAGVGAAVVTATGSLDVSSAAWEALAVVLAFFLVGFALYAALFAIAGAIVPRQEDLQASTGPLMVLIIASFFAAFAAVGEPDGGLARTLTFVPPCAPMVIPVRILAGDVPAWEVVAGTALVALTAALLAAVAVRIYAGAVLRTGGRVALKDAWRAG